MQPRFKNGTNFSCYESLPKGYSECVQYPSPQKNRPLAAQLKSPFGDSCSKNGTRFLLKSETVDVFKPGFLKTGLAKKSTHSTTWQLKTVNNHSKAD